MMDILGTVIAIAIGIVIAGFILIRMIENE